MPSIAGIALVDHRCQPGAMNVVSTSIDGTLPATLYRLRDFDLADGVAEEVGSGQFSKMVRIAISDPDNELWRYSVAVGDVTLTGEQIIRFGAR